MKVIAINGSPHKNGNTTLFLQLMADELKAEGIDTEIVQVGDKLLHGCIACGHCGSSEDNLCVFKDDLVNETSLKMRAADGIILAAPTYYAGIPGAMKAFLDRVFYSSSRYFSYKVGAVATVVRRAGGVDVVHQLNNYFNLSQTVSPPSQYWTAAYGRAPGEVLQDAEGIQTIRRNARGIAWLLKVIDASKGSIPLPKDEPRAWTHFIR